MTFSLQLDLSSHNGFNLTHYPTPVQAQFAQFVL